MPLTKKRNSSPRRAVVLLSGGLDSAVTLFYAAKKEGYECHCVSFYYGQRHKRELELARKIAAYVNVPLRIVKLDMPWKGSSLTDRSAAIPSGRSIEEIKKGIPATYVPARNTIFLSMAASFAESIGAEAIFIGAHSEDSSGYPDCRIEYLRAFNETIKLGTRRGLEGKMELKFPLADKTKSRIIKLGSSLGVPFELTMSCYKGRSWPCMECDSCVLRAKGFREAGIRDPLTEPGRRR